MKQHLSLSHPCMIEHGNDSHPEKPERLKEILHIYEKSPLRSHLDLTCERQATLEELSSVHHPDYIQHVLALDGQHVMLDPETILAPGSVRAALTAAGL